ncbi:MAG: hypothetical protein GXY36_10450 [Chloroflexi bacterium]|nr:hypothetical protein [Chloroflexota bacterium]
MWINTFDRVFLQLDRAGVIRQALGGTEALLGVSIEALKGMTWEALAGQYAAQASREGLRALWEAVVEGRVALAHWPPFVPFRAGVKARLRPARGAELDSFVAELATSVREPLHGLITEHVLDSATQLHRLSGHVLRGVEGPLTDPQVKGLGSMATQARYMRQLLEDIRAEMLLPAVEAPLPRPLSDLLGVDEQHTFDRRQITHRLTLRCTLDSTPVYCYTGIRSVVLRLLHRMVLGVSAESTITIAVVSGQDDAALVQVAITYHTPEIDLYPGQRVEPLHLADQKRVNGTTLVRLLSAVQAQLAPVAGQVWAEPVGAASEESRVILALPRWRTSNPD